MSGGGRAAGLGAEAPGAGCGAPEVGYGLDGARGGWRVREPCGRRRSCEAGVRRGFRAYRSPDTLRRVHTVVPERRPRLLNAGLKFLSACRSGVGVTATSLGPRRLPYMGADSALR
jgi:hypothetical protein